MGPCANSRAEEAPGTGGNLRGNYPLVSKKDQFALFAIERQRELGALCGGDQFESSQITQDKLKMFDSEPFRGLAGEVIVRLNSGKGGDIAAAQVQILRDLASPKSIPPLSEVLALHMWRAGSKHTY